MQEHARWPWKKQPWQAQQQARERQKEATKRSKVVYSPPGVNVCFKEHWRALIQQNRTMVGRGSHSVHNRLTTTTSTKRGGPGTKKRVKLAFKANSRTRKTHCRMETSDTSDRQRKATNVRSPVDWLIPSGRYGVAQKSNSSIIRTSQQQQFVETLGIERNDRNDRLNSCQKKNA